MAAARLPDVARLPKRCTYCGRDLPLNAFNWIKRTGKYSARCHKCLGQYTSGKLPPTKHPKLRKKLTARERKAWAKMVETAKGMTSIMAIAPQNIYGSIDIEAMRRQKPYQLMMAECEAAEGRRK